VLLDAAFLFNLPERDLINVAVSEVYLINFLFCFSTFMTLAGGPIMMRTSQPSLSTHKKGRGVLVRPSRLGVICVSQTRMIKF